MSSFYKNFSKIFFLLLLISVFSLFKTEKSFAYTVPLNSCSLTDVSHTDYVITASDLNGTLPLCFSDPDVSQTLTLKAGGSLSTFNLSSYRINNLGNEDLSDTYTFSGGVEHRVNYTKNFPSLPTGETETNFFLSDGTNVAPATYRLTLLPAYKVKFLNQDGAGAEFPNKANTPNTLVVYDGRSVNTAFGGTYTHTPTYTGTNPTGGSYTFGGWCKNNTD